MKKLSLLSLAVLTILLLDSCSTLKRRYSSGYTVVWNSKSKSNKINSTVDASVKKNKAVKQESSLTESNSIASSSMKTSPSNVIIENPYLIYNNSSNSEIASIYDNNSISQSHNGIKNVFEKSSIESSEAKINSNDKVIKSPIKTFKNKIKQESAAGDTELIIGIILCLFGLAPFGVRYVKGKRDSAYKTNLMIWLGGWGCLLIGIITAVLMASAGSLSFLGLALYGIGGLLLFISFIHGLISILK
jgi:hypothetical protein